MANAASPMAAPAIVPPVIANVIPIPGGLPGSPAWPRVPGDDVGHVGGGLEERSPLEIVSVRGTEVVGAVVVGAVVVGVDVDVGVAVVDVVVGA